MNIKLSMVQSKEDYHRVLDFAQSFPDLRHGRGNLELPIYTISDKEGMFAYYQLISHPIIYPAFHPDKTTPRKFREAADAMIASQQFISISPQFPNGQCLVGMDEKPAIEESVLRKFGFADTHVKIWRKI
jgi:hypothetical protein